MEEELDLIKYWEVLRKRWLVVVVIPLIAALTSGIVSFFILRPVYEASTTLIVGQKAGDNVQQAGQLLQYNVILANQQLAKTYATIAKSRTVEQSVIYDLKLPLNVEELDRMISVAQVTDTDVLKISVVNVDPQLATNIANTLAEKFSNAVIQIKKVDSVSIVDNAVIPDKPVKPRKSLNILIAFAVGLLISLGLAFLLEHLDNTLKSSRDVEGTLELPVLGVIPQYEIDEL